MRLRLQDPPRAPPPFRKIKKTSAISAQKPTFSSFAARARSQRRTAARSCRSPLCAPTTQSAPWLRPCRLHAPAKSHFPKFAQNSPSLQMRGGLSQVPSTCPGATFPRATKTHTAPQPQLRFAKQSHLPKWHSIPRLTSPLHRDATKCNQMRHFSRNAHFAYPILSSLTLAPSPLQP